MRWCQRRCKRTRLGPGKTLTSAEQMRPLPTREWDRDLKSVGRQQVGREHTPRRERGKDLLSGSTVQPDGRDVVSRATLSKCFSARPDQYTVLWPDLSSALRRLFLRDEPVLEDQAHRCSPDGAYVRPGDFLPPGSEVSSAVECRRVRQ